MIIFTSICANYAHKARTLAQSVKAHIPDATFVLCLVEREADPRIPGDCFDEVVLARDAWEGNFDQFLFRHLLVEASTSVKGQFFRYLYRRFPEETHFVYLDPDCYVYADFTELRALLETRPIVLCPHLLQPGNIDMEISSMAHGVYNLGFLAVNASKEAHRFIDWWAERLSMFCYDDIPRGIFTDQKWVDLAPCFFDVEIFKHRGYDFATWSLLDCNMKAQDGAVTISGDPLRFIHYSGYGAVLDKCCQDWLPPGDHCFKALYRAYAALHEANNADGISKTPWSYSSFLSGEEILPEVRLLYRYDPDILRAQENPYQRSNAYFQRMGKRQQQAKQAPGIPPLPARAVAVLRQEGFGSFFRRAARKVKRRLNMPR